MCNYIHAPITLNCVHVRVCTLFCFDKHDAQFGSLCMHTFFCVIAAMVMQITLQHIPSYVHAAQFNARQYTQYV